MYVKLVFQCLQPVHLTKQIRHICRPQATCGPPFTNSSVLQTHLEQTPFFTSYLLLMSQPPPHQLQIRRASILLSLCPPLIVHSHTRLVPSSPRQSVLPTVLPVSRPRCRDFRIRHLFVASRSPSWFLAFLCSSRSCNYAFYGTSSLYSPGSPKVRSSLLFPLIVFSLVNFIQTPSTKFSLLWETASTCESQLPLKFQTHYLSSFSLLSGHLYLGFLSTTKPGTFTEQPEQTQHSKGHHPKVH